MACVALGRGECVTVGDEMVDATTRNGRARGAETDFEIPVQDRSMNAHPFGPSSEYQGTSQRSRGWFM